MSKKLIHMNSVEATRIRMEVDIQVRAELGLSGLDRREMENDDFCHYWEVLKSRLEDAGIDVAGYFRELEKELCNEVGLVGMEVLGGLSESEVEQIIQQCLAEGKAGRWKH